MESAPLGASWAPSLLRVCGRLLVVAGVLGVAVAAAAAVAVTDREAALWGWYGLAPPPTGVGHAVAAAALAGAHLVAAVLCATAGAAALGLGRLVVCAERADGWLRATARNTARGGESDAHVGASQQRAQDNAEASALLSAYPPPPTDPTSPFA